MSNMEAKIREYREMKMLAEEAQAAADSIADELKAAMADTGQEEMIIGYCPRGFGERKEMTEHQVKILCVF